MDFTVVLTHYNDGPYLGPCLREIQRLFDGSRYRLKVLLIDDASDAASRAAGEALAVGRPDVTFVYHDRRIGRGASVAEGVRLADSELVGFIDVDLEIPAYSLYPLALALEDGAHVATVDRVYFLEWDAVFRWILSKGYLVFSRWMTGSRVHDPETGCKAFRRSAILPVLDRVQSAHWFWDTETVVLAEQAGLRIAEVPVAIKRLRDRVSTVRVWKTVWEHFRGLVRLRRRLRDGAKR